MITYCRFFNIREMSFNSKHRTSACHEEEIHEIRTADVMLNGEGGAANRDLILEITHADHIKGCGVWGVKLFLKAMILCH